jgi:nucleotide-binding universal stress UspA family protein
VGEDPHSFEAVLATAWLIAERFGSYVEGVAIRAPATSEGLEAEEFARKVRLEVARTVRLKATFQEFARGRQISGDPGAGERGSVSANWPIDDPVLVQTLGELGRVFDLILVGRSGEAPTGADTPVMESALFDSGRPVLIAPQNAPKSIGNAALISWNGASESARAVAFALPFLHAAGDVLVLEVEDGSVVGPDARDLRTYLTRHGISSQRKTVPQGGAETGQVVLDEAAAFGADLIIMGAFTHSRFRQMIFGGATKYLLASSTIPVLMAH